MVLGAWFLLCCLRMWLVVSLRLSSLQTDQWSVTGLAWLQKVITSYAPVRHLVLNSSHILGISDTFCPVVKPTTIRLLLSIMLL